MKLDAFDKKILMLLQKNSRITQRDLSSEINLSASAINRRIAAMEHEGIIKKNTVIVDAHMVGRPITIITQVSLINERLDLLEERKKRFVQCPQVQQVYYVTGDFDFLLIDPDSDISRLLRQKTTYRYKLALGTKPKVYRVPFKYGEVSQ